MATLFVENTRQNLCYACVFLLDIHHFFLHILSANPKRPEYIIKKRRPMVVPMLKRGLNAKLDGERGLMEFAGDAPLMYYPMDEAQEGWNAFTEKRDSDFDQSPKFP